jgi:hypothetical protein
MRQYEGYLRFIGRIGVSKALFIDQPFLNLAFSVTSGIFSSLAHSLSLFVFPLYVSSRDFRNYSPNLVCCNPV